MRKSVSNILVIILIILILVIVNCVPSSYQSPRVLKPREKALGVGFSFGKYDDITPADLSPYFRYGVFNKVDLGLKICGFPEFGYSLFFDTKYCFLEQPFLITGDLGFMTYADYFAPDCDLKAYGFHPTVLFGNDQIYGGVGWNYFLLREKNEPMFEEPYISISRESGPRIMIGTSLGRRWKFYSEIIFNFHTGDRSPAPVIVGFGIHRVFIKKN